MVAEPLGCQRLVPRDHLVDYAEALFDGRVTAAYGMTQPIPDCGAPESPARRRAVRRHRRRCSRCHPTGNPRPLKADGAAYARRRNSRRRRR